MFPPTPVPMSPSPPAPLPRRHIPGLSLGPLVPFLDFPDTQYSLRDVGCYFSYCWRSALAALLRDLYRMSNKGKIG